MATAATNGKWRALGAALIGAAVLAATAPASLDELISIFVRENE